MNRRKFIAAGAVGLGAATTGAVAGWFGAGSKRGKTDKRVLDARYTYDVSAFEHTDPALLLYEQTRLIAAGIQEPSCLAVGPGDMIFVGGDQSVKVLDKDGNLKSTLRLAERPHALAPSEDGRLFVAMKDHLEVLDRTGKSLVRGETLGDKTHLTAVAFSGKDVFVADAGNREVLRCDPGNGKVLSRFGKSAGNGDHPGFAVPSPCFDLMIGSDGLLWVVNPGRHRVEAFTLDGRFQRGWGTTALSIEGFCGCCNPVYFTQLPDGRFVTSEKGLNRIKIYDAEGKFQGVVAGPEHLVKDRELARKACANGQIGFGYDVACDSMNRVLALDPVGCRILIFTPKTGKRMVPS